MDRNKKNRVSRRGVFCKATKGYKRVYIPVEMFYALLLEMIYKRLLWNPALLTNRIHQENKNTK